MGDASASCPNQAAPEVPQDVPSAPLEASRALPIHAPLEVDGKRVSAYSLSGSPVDRCLASTSLGAWQALTRTRFSRNCLAENSLSLGPNLLHSPYVASPSQALFLPYLAT